MCRCQEGKDKQNKTAKKTPQRIIKSFQFHRRSSTFFHLHNTNKWAAAYLHSCSLKHAHSFWHTLTHTHTHAHSPTCRHVHMGHWHSSATLGISRLFMWLHPKYFTSQLLFHALSECVPACQRDGGEEEKKKNVGLGDGEMQNGRGGKWKEGMSSERKDKRKNFLPFHESNVNRCTLSGSQIAREKHVDVSCKWSKYVFFFFFWSIGWRGSCSHRRRSVCVWWSDWQNTLPEVGEMKEEMKRSNSGRGRGVEGGVSPLVRLNVWSRTNGVGMFWLAAGGQTGSSVCKMRLCSFMLCCRSGIIGHQSR